MDSSHFAPFTFYPLSQENDNTLLIYGLAFYLLYLVQESIDLAVYKI
jgi:hypothetical protein